MTEQQGLNKVNRNNEQGKNGNNKVQSSVKMPDDIVWTTKSDNKFIRTSVIHEDLTLTIDINGKKYNVRSPAHYIIDDIENLQSKFKDLEEADIPKGEMLKLKQLYKDMLHDMIEGLNTDDRSVRISSQDMQELIVLCWRYHLFLTQKSTAMGGLSISEYVG